MKTKPNRGNRPSPYFLPSAVSDQGSNRNIPPLLQMDELALSALDTWLTLALPKFMSQCENITNLEDSPSTRLKMFVLGIQKYKQQLELKGLEKTQEVTKLLMLAETIHTMLNRRSSTSPTATTATASTSNGIQQFVGVRVSEFRKNAAEEISNKFEDTEDADSGISLSSNQNSELNSADDSFSIKQEERLCYSINSSELYQTQNLTSRIYEPKNEYEPSWRPWVEDSRNFIVSISKPKTKPVSEFPTTPWRPWAGGESQNQNLELTIYEPKSVLAVEPQVIPWRPWAGESQLKVDELETSFLCKSQPKRDLIVGLLPNGAILKSFQEFGLNAILEKRDLILEHGPGTGKTTTALIGVVHSIDMGNHLPQAIVVVPTEVHNQEVKRILNKLGQRLNPEIPMYVSAEETQDSRSLSGFIIVGTPEQVKKLVSSDSWKFKNRKIKFLVFDGIEEMPNEQCLHQIYQFGTTGDTQIIVLGRTLNSSQMVLAQGFTPKQCQKIPPPIPIRIAEQFYVVKEAYPHDVSLLVDILFATQEDYPLIQVFCKVTNAKNVFHHLLNAGLHCELYGSDIDLTMQAKICIIPEQNTHFIVPLQRGTLVINYDCPCTKESYIERLGILDPFKKDSDPLLIEMITFTNPDEVKILQEVVTQFGINIQDLRKTDWSLFIEHIGHEEHNFTLDD